MSEEWLRHLKVAVGLAGLPRDLWSEADHTLLKEAREFIRKEEVRLGKISNPSDGSDINTLAPGKAKTVSDP